VAYELNINLDPLTLSGLSMRALLYFDGALAASVALTESPAGSAAYSNTSDLPTLAAATYAVTFVRADTGASQGTGELNWSGSAETQLLFPAVGYFATTAAADAIAVSMLGLANYQFATAYDKATALTQASEDVDTAMRYQGRRYDPANQIQEFPRVAYESRPAFWGPAGQVAVPMIPGPGNTIWDWDYTTQLPIVPPRVLEAVIWQADWLLGGAAGSDRLAAQYSGLRGQATGQLREDYAPSSHAVASGLCIKSWRLMQRYELSSGRLL
jgi:hypothetical protein